MSDDSGGSKDEVQLRSDAASHSAEPTAGQGVAPSRGSKTRELANLIALLHYISSDVEVFSPAAALHIDFTRTMLEDVQEDLAASTSFHIKSARSF